MQGRPQKPVAVSKYSASRCGLRWGARGIPRPAGGHLTRTAERGIVGLGPASPVNPGRSQCLFRADVVREANHRGSISHGYRALRRCSEAVRFLLAALSSPHSAYQLAILTFHPIRTSSMHTLLPRSTPPCSARDISTFKPRDPSQQRMTGSR